MWVYSHFLLPLPIFEYLNLLDKCVRTVWPCDHCRPLCLLWGICERTMLISVHYTTLQSKQLASTTTDQPLTVAIELPLKYIWLYEYNRCHDPTEYTRHHLASLYTWLTNHQHEDHRGSSFLHLDSELTCHFWHLVVHRHKLWHTVLMVDVAVLPCHSVSQDDSVTCWKSYYPDLSFYS